MLKLLKQYFEGDSLDQIISLISLMRSQDEVNYEIGLMYMKELKLYSTFIKMLDEYYGQYILPTIYVGDDKKLLSSERYDQFLLDFSFKTVIYTVNGRITKTIGTIKCKVSTKDSYWIEFVHLNTITFPIFCTQLDYFSFQGEKMKQYRICNGGDIDYCLDYFYSDSYIINLPKNITRFDHLDAYNSLQCLNEIPDTVKFLTLSFNELGEMNKLDVLGDFLLKYDKLSFLDLCGKYQYFGGEVRLPISLEGITFYGDMLKQYGDILSDESKQICLRFLADNDILNMPNLICVRGLNLEDGNNTMFNGWKCDDEDYGYFREV